MPKKNPITVLSKKNRLVFTKVIPTLRKIQEKKYFEDCYKEKQKRETIEYYVKDVERRVNYFFERNHKMSGKNTKDGPFNIKFLTKKEQVELSRFIRTKIKELDLTKAPSELKAQLEEIKFSVRSYLFKIEKDLKRPISKDKVLKKLAEDIDFYDFLKLHHKQIIIDLVNYNLALVTREKHLTSDQFNALKTAVQKLIDRKIDYSYAKKAKEISDIKAEVISFRAIAQDIKTATKLERIEIIKHIDALIEEEYDSRTSHIIDAVIKKYGREKFKSE